MQNAMTRWCRSCGLPGSSGQGSCSGCGSAPVRRPRKALSQILNTDNGMVQNNILNVDVQELNLGFASAPPEIPPGPTFGQKVFTFACSAVFWMSVLVFGSVVATFVALLYATYLRYHAL